MRFDRQIFFEQYRRLFGPINDQYVVDGLNRLVTGFETYHGWWDDIRQISNALAQVRWETNQSYTPVEEGYYLGDADEPGYFDGENSAAVKRLQKSFRYFPHFGRGDIQLTWAENYKDQDHRIRKWFPERVAEFERRTGKRFDLVGDPDQALDPWISFCIFTIGMHLGTFRPGRNLDRYITPSKTDHFNARDIVNGDKNYIKNGKKIGIWIAEDAKRFEAVLKSALLPGQIDPSDEEIDTIIDNIGPDTTSPPVTLPISVAPPDTPDLGIKPAENETVSAVETAPAGDQPIETRATSESEDGKQSVEVVSKNEQDVNVPAQITEPEPYNKIGFFATIKRDLVAVTGGNIGFESLSTYAQQASGWPEWIVAILGKLAVVALIAGAGYLLFRTIHFFVDAWKQNKRTSHEVAAKTAIDRKDIEWMPSEPK